MFLSLETLTSIIRTGLPILVKLINLVDSAISYGLIQILNFPTQISPPLLHFFLSSDASICSPMTFPPLGNSYHVVMFHGRLSLSSVLLLLLVNFVSGFRLELMCVSLIDNIRSSLPLSP